MSDLSQAIAAAVSGLNFAETAHPSVEVPGFPGYTAELSFERFDRRFGLTLTVLGPTCVNASQDQLMSLPAYRVLLLEYGETVIASHHLYKGIDRALTGNRSERAKVFTTFYLPDRAGWETVGVGRQKKLINRRFTVRLETTSAEQSA